jgi:hypothetical protein
LIIEPIEDWLAKPERSSGYGYEDWLLVRWFRAFLKIKIFKDKQLKIYNTKK